MKKAAAFWTPQKNISLGLAKKAVAGEVNGKAVDLGYILNEGDKVKIITENRCGRAGNSPPLHSPPYGAGSAENLPQS
ncbi:MAG: TGS domain-containing protein [Geovibrio sp.]|nr:TGS domain-containing protein [Geovibrio sp.]